MVILQYLIATENTLAGDLLRCCDEGHTCDLLSLSNMPTRSVQRPQSLLLAH